MHAGMASDEVTDQIALIEMHRQEKQKEAGVAAACSEALHKLQELLESEKAALQQNGPDQGHPANIAAVTQHIQRVKQLAGNANRQQQKPRHGRPQQPQRQARPGGGGGPRNSNNAPRGKGRNRRPMGRRGDR